MFHNLLPSSRKKQLKRDYYFRIISVTLLALSVATVTGIISLVPAYVNIYEQLGASKTEFESRKNDNQDNKNLIKEAKERATVIEILQNGLQKQKLTDLLNEVLVDIPDGIKIVGFSYNRNDGILTLEGFAKSRNLVAPYAKSLEESVLFESVPVPISDLAKSSDLEFHLSIKLSKPDKTKK